MFALSSPCICLPFHPSSLHPYSQPSILLSSLTSTQGESAGLSQAELATRDMQFETLSWRAFLHDVLTPIPLLWLLTPLHYFWSITSKSVLDFYTFSSPCSHLYTPLSPSLFHLICCPFSTLLKLYVCMFLSLFPLSCTVKSDSLDKCGSMVKQIPEAPERAKINHFSPSLSSAHSLPLSL